MTNFQTDSGAEEIFVIGECGKGRNQSRRSHTAEASARLAEQDIPSHSCSGNGSRHTCRTASDHQHIGSVPHIDLTGIKHSIPHRKNRFISNQFYHKPKEKSMDFVNSDEKSG